jgi:hypothetical protein
MLRHSPSTHHAKSQLRGNAGSVCCEERIEHERKLRIENMRKILPDGCAATRQNLPACRSVRPTSRRRRLQIASACIDTYRRGLARTLSAFFTERLSTGGWHTLRGVAVSTAHRTTVMDLLPLARRSAIELNWLAANLAYLGGSIADPQGDDLVARFRHRELPVLRSNDLRSHLHSH